MDIIASLADKLYYLSFLFVLGVVIFVHEFGHYIVGRWCGIHAEVFSLGFGKELFHWTDRRGTRWRVGILPLGGYVKFLGDVDGTSTTPDEAALKAMDPKTRAHSFHGAAVWRRALAVAAGPVANFILSIIVFAGLALWIGRGVDGPVVGTVGPVPGYADQLEPGDRLLSVDGRQVGGISELYTIARDMPVPGPLPVTVARGEEVIATELPYPLAPLVGWVSPLSAAMRAGLEEGDVILSADGVPLPAFADLQAAVIGSEGRPLELGVLRDGQEIPVTLTPRMQDIQLADGSFEQRPMIGITGGLPLRGEVETPGPIDALGIGVEGTWRVIEGSVSGIYNIITGTISARNLQGTLGMAQASGESARSGFDDLLNLLAVISTAIGFLNLMPIPVLDGGHLVFLGYEAIRGRPPADRWVEYASGLGLAMVLMLMLFATYNDVLRLIGLA